MLPELIGVQLSKPFLFLLRNISQPQRSYVTERFCNVRLSTQL